jgi:hypothetical protein
MMRNDSVMMTSSVGTRMAMRRIANASILGAPFSRLPWRAAVYLSAKSASRDYHAPQFMNLALPFVNDAPPFVNNVLPTAAAACTTVVQQVHGYRTSIR